MSKNITLNINNAQSTVETVQVKTAQGAPVRIPAQANVNYQFIEDATQVGPENIMTKRVGQNLEIAFEGSSIENPDLIIENYYAPDGQIGYAEGRSNLLIGEHENGNMYPYVPESAVQEDAVSMLADEVQAGQALGGEVIGSALWMLNPLWLLGLLPLAGIAAASGGSSDSDNNEPALTISVSAPDNTADNTPVITGETNAPSGSVVTVTITDSQGATQVVTTIVSETGEYSVEPTTPLASGNYTVQATVVSAEDSNQTATANDPGNIIVITVDAPDLTADNTPTITGATDAPAGSVVEILITDINGATQTISATVQADGTYASDVINPLPNGEYTAVATVADKDGYTVQATDPGTVAASLPVVTVNAPDNTSDNTPTITGTADVPAGTPVTLVITDSEGNTQTVTTVVDEVGEYSVDVPNALPDGNYTATATVKDPAGNEATATDPGSIDTTAPTITVDAPDNSNDSTPTITGTTDAPAGSVVTIVVTDSEGVTQTVTTTVKDDGTYSVDVPEELPEGDYTATATVKDPAGNEATATDPGSIDTTAPTITVDAPDNSNDSTPTITGTTDAPAGSVVTIVVTDSEGATQTVTTTVKDDGTYSVDVPEELPEGDYTVDASVKDPAGNEGSASDNGSVDTTAPTIIAEDQSVVEASGNTVSGIIKVNDTNGVTAVTIAGKDVLVASSTNPVVITTANGTLSVTGYDQANGTITYTYTENGSAKDHSAGDDSVVDRFVVSVKDAAGNSTLDFVDITITDTAPVAVDDRNAISETGISVNGNVLANDTVGADLPVSVEVGNGSGAYGQLVLNNDGTYTYTLNRENTEVKGLSKGESLTDSFTYTIVDSDGDSSTATLNITINGVDDKLVIGGNTHDGCLRGGDGNDVIIGDKGGFETILTATHDYNVAIVLDISNSMLDYKTDNGTRYLEMARSSLLKLANDLGNHDGEINVSFMTFNRTVDMRLNISDLNESNVDQLLQNIRSLSVIRGTQGATNYDAAFDTAAEWFESVSSNGYENITYFVTDGEPTVYGETGYNGSGAYTTQTVIDAALDSFSRLSDVSAVHAFGLAQGINATTLNYFDNTSKAGVEETVDIINKYDGREYRDVTLSGESGDSAIVHTPNDLDAALVTGTTTAVLHKVAGDNIQGGAGDDIIFGDSINTDGLSWTENGLNYNAGSHDGMGLTALNRYIQWSENNGAEATDQQVSDYIRENWKDLLDNRPDGGNDFIRGGDGNDIIFGGSGNDTLHGGEGADQFVFLANSNSGKDYILDFEAGVDKVVFADLVSADQLQGAVWNDASHTLNFTGVGADGQSYNNSITFTGLSSGQTLESVLENHTQFIG